MLTPAPTTGVAFERVHQLQYVFPVQPPRVATYPACHHDYPASDIFAPVGAEYVAVVDGIIDFVSAKDEWNPATDEPSLRGGLSIALIGEDGVRYYGSHFESIAEGIKPGLRVKAGQTLARVGKSGNARNTPPHVHFGISQPTTADDWAVRRGRVDRYRYLNAWRRGENITPDLSQLAGGVC